MKSVVTVNTVWKMVNPARSTNFSTNFLVDLSLEQNWSKKNRKEKIIEWNTQMKGTQFVQLYNKDIS